MCGPTTDRQVFRNQCLLNEKSWCTEVTEVRGQSSELFAPHAAEDADWEQFINRALHCHTWDQWLRRAGNDDESILSLYRPSPPPLVPA